MSFILVKNSAKTITTLTNIFFGSIPRPKKMKSKLIKNAKKITYSQWKSFAFDTISFCCNMTCLLLITVYAEFPQLMDGNQEIWFVSDCMLIAAYCSGIFHFLSYLNDLQMQNLAQDDQQPVKSTFALNIIYGILKSLYLTIHPSHFLTDYPLNSQTFPNINSLLATISYFRIIFIYFYLSKMSRYYGTRISRLLSVYGHRSKSTNIAYTIKCLFKERGMIANIMLLSFTIIFMGLVGMLVSQDKSLVSQMYYLVETMATIGYGEFAVRDSVQRVVFVVVIILGSFAASVFTIDLLNFLELEDKELKAYRLIKRLEYQSQINTSKLSIIQKFIKNTNSTKNYKKNAISIWKQYEKQLEIDKSPMLEYLTVKYTYFCNSLKILLERQLLSNNLLTFYFNRRVNYDLVMEELAVQGVEVVGLGGYGNKQKYMEEKEKEGGSQNQEKQKGKQNRINNNQSNISNKINNNNSQNRSESNIHHNLSNNSSNISSIFNHSNNNNGCNNYSMNRPQTSNKRRVEDSYKFYLIKEKILGYKK